MNSIFWELRYEKHKNQMKDCGVELRVSDLQMNAWTWRVYDTVKARRGMADDRYEMLCRLSRNSIFWELRYEKHENQLKGRGVELKVSDWQINAWILWACDTVKARQCMAA